MSPGLGLGLGLAKIVSLTPPHRSIRRIRRVAPLRYDVVAVDGVATAVEVGGRGHCQPGARLSQLRDLVRDATLRVRQAGRALQMAHRGAAADWVGDATLREHGCVVVHVHDLDLHLTQRRRTGCFNADVLESLQIVKSRRRQL